jgi:hypothetical protein
MPLTEDNSKMLLLFPNAIGFNYKVVVPGFSESSDPQIKQRDEENFRSEFDFALRPSDKPSVFSSWQIDGMSAFMSFEKNQELFPVAIRIKLGDDPNALVAQAEALARRMQVRNIRTDEVSMAQLDLGSDLPALFEVVGGEWDRLKGENNSARRALEENLDKPEAA